MVTELALSLDFKREIIRMIGCEVVFSFANDINAELQYGELQAFHPYEHILGVVMTTHRANRCLEIPLSSLSYFKCRYDEPHRQFKIDGDYHDMIEDEKNLQEWQPELEFEETMTLETKKRWSVEAMFEANVKLGVQSTFEGIDNYSTAQPMGNEEDRRRAEAIALEIERNEQSKYNACLENDDEERDIKEYEASRPPVNRPSAVNQPPVVRPIPPVRPTSANKLASQSKVSGKVTGVGSHQSGHGSAQNSHGSGSNSQGSAQNSHGSAQPLAKENIESWRKPKASTTQPTPSLIQPNVSSTQSKPSSLGTFQAGLGTPQASHDALTSHTTPQANFGSSQNLAKENKDHGKKFTGSQQNSSSARPTFSSTQSRSSSHSSQPLNKEHNDRRFKNAVRPSTQVSRPSTHFNSATIQANPSSTQPTLSSNEPKPSGLISGQSVTSSQPLGRQDNDQKFRSGARPSAQANQPSTQVNVLSTEAKPLSSSQNLSSSQGSLKQNNDQRFKAGSRPSTQPTPPSTHSNSITSQANPSSTQSDSRIQPTAPQAHVEQPQTRPKSTTPPSSQANSTTPPLSHANFTTPPSTQASSTTPPSSQNSAKENKKFKFNVTAPEFRPTTHRYPTPPEQIYQPEFVPQPVMVSYGPIQGMQQPIQVPPPQIQPQIQVQQQIPQQQFQPQMQSYNYAPNYQQNPTVPLASVNTSQYGPFVVASQYAPPPQYQQKQFVPLQTPRPQQPQQYHQPLFIPPQPQQIPVQYPPPPPNQTVQYFPAQQFYAQPPPYYPEQ